MKRFAGLAALLCAACTGAPPSASLSQPIIMGSVDDGDPAVVAVFAQVPGSQSASLCSGEVISPHVVLTAAHCVAPSSVGEGAQFLIFTGTSFTFGLTPPTDNTFPTTGAVASPMWNSGATSDDEDPWDVGIVHLASPIGIPPLPYNHFALSNKLIEKPVRIVGFGLTDPADGTTAGTRHNASTLLNFIRPLGIELWDHAHGTCEGDSGGPAFMMLDGKERITGITAFGYAGCRTDLVATDTRVDAVASFIDGYVNMYDPPAVQPGGACTADSDCGTLPCLDGVCTPPCDPSTAPACPTGLTCTTVDDSPRCAKGGGCALAGSTSDGSAVVLVLAAVALLALSGARRRRSIWARGTDRSWTA